MSRMSYFGRMPRHPAGFFLWAALLASVLLVAGAAQKTASAVRQPLIAFISDRDGTVDLYVVRADGSGLTAVTHDASQEDHPVWSPDGTLLAYDSTRGNKFFYSIWTVKPQGGDSTRRTLENDRATVHSWLDNQRIAYLRPEEGGKVGFGYVTLGSTMVHKLSDQGVEYVVSPDRARVAIQLSGHDYRIAVMKSDGSGQRTLTSGGHEYSPAWSPDSGRIAYQVGEVKSNEVAESGIWVMDADGGSARRLTDFGYLPHWLPDGRSLVFLAPASGGELPRIFKPEEGGGRPTQLGEGSDLAVSYSSKRIAFLKKDQLWVMDLNGGNKRSLAGNISSFQWPAGSAALLCKRENWKGGQMTGSDILLVNADGSGFVNLTGGKGNNRGAVLQPTGAPLVVPQKPVPGAARVVLLASPGSPGLYYRDPAWSEDGLRVTFAFRHPGQGGSGAWGGVAVIDAQGRNYQSIYAIKPDPPGANVECREPRFSPAGDAVLFTQAMWLPGRAGYHQSLQTVDLTTQKLFTYDPYHLKNLARPRPLLYSRADWSSDGTALFFGAGTAAGSPADTRISAIYRVMWASKDTAALIKVEGMDYTLSSPRQSPDGRWLAFWEGAGKRFRLQLWNQDYKPGQRLTVNTSTRPLPFWWSRDGKFLAWREANRLVLWPVYSGEKRVELEDVSGPAVPSPDFSRVAYYKGHDLWLWEWKSHQKFKLTTLKGEGELPAPQWSPDGSRLLLAWQRSLFIVRW